MSRRFVSWIVGAAMVIGLGAPAFAGTRYDDGDKLATYSVGGQTATYWEWQHQFDARLLIDGRDVTDQVGPLMALNGRTMVWGRGLANALDGGAIWNGRNGTSTYLVTNNKTDFGIGSWIRFHPGTERGCGSSTADITWSYTVRKPNVFGIYDLPKLQDDTINMDAPACTFFASEMVYVPLKAMTEALKFNVSFISGTRTVEIHTDEVPRPDYTAVSKLKYTWVDEPAWYTKERGFMLQKPDGGISAYPATVLYGALAGQEMTKVADQLKQDNFDLSDSGHGYLVVRDRSDGTLYAHIYPTHAVVYIMDPIQVDEFVTKLENQLTIRSGWISGLAMIASAILTKDTRLGAVILTGIGVGAGIGTIYYAVNNATVNTLKTCRDDVAKVDKSKYTPGFGIIVANGEITGCVYRVREVTTFEAMGG